MILIDPADWPAHGTMFGHLVSDASLDELHDFARAHGVPPRAFDHDHYDVARERYSALIAAGAVPVSSRELVARLIGAGLRVRRPDKTPERAESTARAWRRWRGLLPDQPELGTELIERWSEPHRRYHDVRHLEACLAALDEVAPSDLAADDALAVRLAVWFHDAVYRGRAGDDERASAALAERVLTSRVARPVVDEVVRLVLLTIEHRCSPDDRTGALLIDADLSVLGQNRGRYHVYLRDVREEYAAVSDEDFRRGRLAVVEALLALDPLFQTEAARSRWSDRARTNLREERVRLLGGVSEPLGP